MFSLRLRLTSMAISRRCRVGHAPIVPRLAQIGHYKLTILLNYNICNKLAVLHIEYISVVDVQ